MDWIENDFDPGNSEIFGAVAVIKKLEELPVIGEIEIEARGMFEMMRHGVKWVRTVIQRLLNKRLL